VLEWMTQYLHGAQPEDADPGSQQMSSPSHWMKTAMPPQGWRVVPLSETDAVFKQLQRVLNPERCGPWSWSRLRVLAAVPKVEPKKSMAPGELCALEEV
jgi:hypothetical protein